MDTSGFSGVPMQLNYTINGVAVVAEIIERKGQSLRIAINGQEYAFVGKRLSDGTLAIDHEIATGVWQRVRGAAWNHKGVNHIQLGAHEFAVADSSRALASVEAAPLSPRAPMPGLVRQVLVKKGEKVTSGQALCVLEAMKLQLTLTAGGDGVVEAILVSEGDMVAENAEMVRVKAL